MIRLLPHFLLPVARLLSPVSVLLLFFLSVTTVSAKPRHRPKRSKPPASAPAREPRPPAPVPPAHAVPDTPAPAPRATARDAKPAVTAAREVVQRESRIEFDERLVQGQTAAGAIYLFQRSDSELRSMVEPPDSFRDRTVRKLLPESRSP